MAVPDRYVVDDPRFAGGQPARTATPYQEPPRRRRSCLAGCLMGCLGMTAVVVLVAGAGVWWLVNNWRELATNVGAEALKDSIAATELPEAEKQEIAVQIDRVAVGFREGRISDRQMQRLIENLIESPLLTSLAASAIESQYIARSGLNEQEQAEARQTLRRYLRGAIDRQIAEADMNAAMAHVADREANGSWRLRDRVSDEDLRRFLKTAKEQADAAAIPAEPENIDPSDEVQRIIDETTGAGPVQAPVDGAPAVEGQR